MSDVQYIRRKVDQIYSELGTIRRMNEMELIARKDELKHTIYDFFGGRDRKSLALCYIAVDGKKTQQQIADALGLNKATVSRRLSKLREDAGYIEPVETGAANVSVYRKNPSYEKVFKLTQYLKKNLP